jgi:putative endonuclease
MNHLKKGLAGELMACEYLKNKGYDVVGQNVRFGKGEIDIIAFKDQCLFFVEVKFRKNNVYGYPEDFVTEKKLQLIQQTAELYVLDKNWKGRIQFDIIAITGSDPIVHIEDVTL